MDSKFGNSDPYMPGPANGELQGVSTSMPDRGTSEGFTGISGSYGADTGEHALNRRGGIGRSTRSDPMYECCPPGGGDFSSSGHDSPGHGRSMGSAADSDPKAETTPDDQRA